MLLSLKPTKQISSVCLTEKDMFLIKLRKEKIWKCLTFTSLRTVYEPVNLSNILKARTYNDHSYSWYVRVWDVSSLSMAHRVNKEFKHSDLLGWSEELILHNDEFITVTDHLVLPYWNPGGYNVLNSVARMKGKEENTEFWFGILMVNIHL